jgi:hypothetical protein
LLEILSDEKNFNTFINRKYLDLSLDDFNKFKCSDDKENISIIQKDHKLINKINFIFWLEHLLNIKRYHIESIEIDNIDLIKEQLLKKINDLILLSDGTKSKAQLIKRYKTKIDKLFDNETIKNFIVDCYNSFGDIINVIRKRIRNKSTKKLEYIKNYQLNII